VRRFTAVLLGCELKQQRQRITNTIEMAVAGRIPNSTSMAASGEQMEGGAMIGTKH
jgi:hypothetical protein